MSISVGQVKGNPEEAAELIATLEAEVERMRAALLNILAKAESGFTFNHANLATQCRRALGDDQQHPPVPK